MRIDRPVGLLFGSCLTGFGLAFVDGDFTLARALLLLGAVFVVAGLWGMVVASSGMGQD